jgi:hypothetical protein
MKSKHVYNPYYQITEDMPRSLREQWGELSKFMTRVKVSRVISLSP